MIDIGNFEAVFAPSENDTDIYPKAVFDAVHANRRSLDGTLFFDRLLDHLDIERDDLFPPSSNADLFELHKRITSSSIAVQHKQSLLFYLLMDVGNGSMGPAKEFARTAYMPLRYSTVTEGFWRLDHLQTTVAVGLLTMPTIAPTFPNEVLQILLKHANSGDAAMRLLPLQYYTAMSSLFEIEPEVLRQYISYLTDQSVTQTYFTIQKHPSSDQRELQERLVQQALSQPGNVAERAEELADLPLTDEEEAWLIHYLLKGKGRLLPASCYTVMMRLVAKGKHSEAVDFCKSLANRGLNVDDFEHVADLLGPRPDVGFVDIPSPGH